ncbi:MAG TPA: NADH-quinone oxidoreductase subunit C [bacterium]|nr:NADH-quinone oxidoreductase subunit C [bacterium]
MTVRELLEKIKQKAEIEDSKEDLGVLNAYVKPSSLRSLLIYMRDSLGFDWMSFMTALDMPQENTIEAVYELFSNSSKDSARIKVKLSRQAAEVETVSDIYRTAEWHEREAAEMFGITFKNHPHPENLILTPDIKAPLRKDFSGGDMKRMPE